MSGLHPMSGLERTDIYTRVVELNEARAEALGWLGRLRMRLDQAIDRGEVTKTCGAELEAILRQIEGISESVDPHP